MENTTNTETASETFRHNGSRRTEVASEILSQVNALDFWARARWGVKAALALGPDAFGIQFNCNKKIRIMIRLDASDTYSIEIGRLRGMNYAKKAEISDVYAEDLVRIIDSEFSKAFGSL